MAGGNMRDLMRHHAGEFGFAVNCQDQSAIHVQVAAGKGENLGVLRIDDLDGDGHLRVGVAGEFLAEAVYVIADAQIGNEFGMPVNALGQRIAQSLLFFE